MYQYGYRPNDVDRITSTYEPRKTDKNKEAENRCDTICIPYVRGPSDSLRKQLAREGVNLVFKRGKTLREFLFNGEPKSQTEERIFATGFHASVVLSVTLGRLFNDGTKENPSTREV